LPSNSGYENVFTTANMADMADTAKNKSGKHIDFRRISTFRRSRRG
jgi:hypothetical protein